MHRLFHPPPEGMPDRIYMADRNDASAQVRARLAMNQSELRDLAEKCVSIERMDVELREVNQKLKQMQQNTVAFKRGAELHEKRGKLLADRERVSKRLKEIEVETTTKEVELADLKRQEEAIDSVLDAVGEYGIPASGPYAPLLAAGLGILGGLLGRRADVKRKDAVIAELKNGNGTS